MCGTVRIYSGVLNAYVLEAVFGVIYVYEY
jgi:hypothetical protein